MSIAEHKGIYFKSNTIWFKKHCNFFWRGAGLLLKLINPTQIILLKFNKCPFENGIENHSKQKCREVTNSQHNFPPR